MNAEPDAVRILRLHKTWADRYTVLWQLLTLLLFVGVYFLLEQSEIEAAERADAFILLAAIILTAAVWQAVGLGVARVHMLLNGVELKPYPGRDRRSRTRRG